jgi:Uma2 family endonuclease
MPVQERLFTAQDLADMPNDGRMYELHNGVLVEEDGSKLRHTRLATRIIYLLTAFVEQYRVGGAVTRSDGSYVLSALNPRIPDVAYSIAENLNQQSPDSFIMGAPDLAVEVMSPFNTAEEMQQRAGEFVRAGSRVVWIVNPDTPIMDVYRPDGTRFVAQGDDVLEGHDVLPGLKLTVNQIFAEVQSS